MLFRKKSTVAAVLALAFLVAIVASMNAIVNFVNFQTSAIGQLATVGDKYLIISQNCSSLSDSHISPKVVNAFNLSEFQYFSSQKILKANLQTASGNYSVTLRGVENLTTYLKEQSVYVNGTAAENMGEADVGALLSRTASLDQNDYANVSVGNARLAVKIVAVTKSQTQLDSELIVPIETVIHLSGDADFSFVEFSFKDSLNRQDAINRLSAFLPKDVEVVKVQQTSLFLQQSTGQVLNFLTLWSTAVYVLVSAASYVVSMRLIVESKYELATLKAIGARRLYVFRIVFMCTILMAFAGAVLGISFGIVGTQVASTALRWLSQGFQVMPFLELSQLAQIVGLSLLFAILGCIYPTLKSTQNKL